jgi:hypothetical protein
LIGFGSNENGYIFEDVCPVIIDNVFQLKLEGEQSDIFLKDNFEERNDPVMKYEGELIKEERGKIMSLRMLKEGRENSRNVIVDRTKKSKTKKSRSKETNKKKEPE